MTTFSKHYTDNNIKIIPIHNPEGDGKCSCKDEGCKSIGKHPRIKEWKEEASSDSSKIQGWINKWPNMNIGIVTGSLSRILVVDVDPRHDGDKSLADFEKENGILPPTLTVKTSGGGRHLYYKYPDNIKLSNRQDVLPGVDIRGEGGFIVAPPSKHVSGITYEFDGDFDISKISELKHEKFISLIFQSSKKKAAAYDCRKPERRRRTVSSVTERALELIRGLKGYHPYLDQYGEPYIRYIENDRFADIPVMNSKGMEVLVKTVFYREEETALNKSQLETVIGNIEAEALSSNEKHTLFLRVAEFNNSLYYDLGDGLSVKIDPDNWNITKNTPILFKRYPISKTQVIPIRDGDAYKIFDFFNIQDESTKLLLLIWIIAGFVENIPHPILIIYGVQGSAKSTSVRYIGKVIDPTDIRDLSIKDVENAMLIFDQIWLAPLDNKSHLRQEESDLLCRMSTGGSLTRRRLYTDSNLMIRHLRRLVVINGIDLVAKQPDLLDRCLIVDLDRIPDSKRKPESILNDSFEKELPSILGGCFDILAKAYAIRPTVKLSSSPRMADFAYWGAAILRAIKPDAIDDDFLKIYDENVKRQENEAINASPLAYFILKYLQEKAETLSGTPTELLDLLKDFAGHNAYTLPKSPSFFGKKIKEIKPSLEKYGIKITIEKGISRTISISVEDNSTGYFPSLPSCCPDESLGYSSEEVPF
jgi:hypothetical protein